VIQIDEQVLHNPRDHPEPRTPEAQERLFEVRCCNTFSISLEAQRIGLCITPVCRQFLIDF